MWWAPAALVAGQADNGIVNRHVERTIVKNHRVEGPGVAVVTGDHVQRQVAQSPVLGQQVRGGFCQLDREHLVAERAGGPPLNSFIRPSEKFSLSCQKVSTGCLYSYGSQQLSSPKVEAEHAVAVFAAVRFSEPPSKWAF